MQIQAKGRKAPKKNPRRKLIAAIIALTAFLLATGLYALATIRFVREGE